MRKSIFLFFASIFLVAYAGRRPIILQPQGQGGDRSGAPIYFDMPTVYYDDTPKRPIIIVDGGGSVSYYDVDIASASTSLLEVTTTVSGTCDTIDVSSLSYGSHVITIASPSGHTFVGNFNTY